MNSEVTTIEPGSVVGVSEPDRQTAGMLQMIERVVMSPELPIDRLEAVIRLRNEEEERLESRFAEKAFNQAFAAAMANMPDVPRSGKNTHLGRRYSTLDDLIRTTRPHLSAQGLTLNWQSGEENDGRIWVTAYLRHVDGHKISTTRKAAADKSGSMNTLQGGGSTETYLKRYTGFALLGLSSGDEVDDDGEALKAAGKRTIDADQYQRLRELMYAANADEAALKKFLAHEGEIEELPVSKFGTAESMLKQKIAKAQKEESPDA